MCKLRMSMAGMVESFNKNPPCNLLSQAKELGGNKSERENWRKYISSSLECAQNRESVDAERMFVFVFPGIIQSA